MKKIAFIASILLVLALVTSCYITEGEKNLEGVKMTAIIKNIDDKIEVEVIEGQYGATGIYWVNFSDDTVFTNAEGVRLSVSSLKVRDTVEITYGGQVMMSYPPQIVALKIEIK